MYGYKKERISYTEFRTPLYLSALICNHELCQILVMDLIVLSVQNACGYFLRKVRVQNRQ